MVAPLAALAVSAATKLAGRGAGHAAGVADAHAQRDAKAVETRTKIRGARRDANGNLLHSDTECSDAPLQRQPIR